MKIGFRYEEALSMPVGEARGFLAAYADLVKPPGGLQTFVTRR